MARRRTQTLPSFAPIPEALLEQERAEMAAHFPHWQLTVLTGTSGTALRCACGGLAQPVGRSATCAACGQAIPIQAGAVLGWVGHLPALVSGRPQAHAKILRHAHPSYPLVQVGEADFLLVPIIAAYSTSWPQSQPTIRYDSHLATMLELPAWFGSTYHMLSENVLCLYYGNQWTAQTMRMVIQQRVVNHLISLIKCADGVPPRQAFVGRIHDERWVAQP